MICEWLKNERKRLGFSQEEFAVAAGVTRRPYAEWEAGKTFPTAAQLNGLRLLGADVQYIVTGERRGDGIGESAIHQAVLDAVDLLSLEKKVDAQQLARAVVKLCQRSATISAEKTVPAQTQNISDNNGQVTQSGQIINVGTPSGGGKKR